MSNQNNTANNNPYTKIGSIVVSVFFIFLIVSIINITNSISKIANAVQKLSIEYSLKQDSK